MAHDRGISCFFSILHTEFLLTPTSPEICLTLDLDKSPTYGKMAVSDLSPIVLVCFLSFGRTEPVVFSRFRMRVTVQCDGWAPRSLACVPNSIRSKKWYVYLLLLPALFIHTDRLARQAKTRTKSFFPIQPLQNTNAREATSLRKRER